MLPIIRLFENSKTNISKIFTFARLKKCDSETFLSGKVEINWFVANIGFLNWFQ